MSTMDRSLQVMLLIILLSSIRLLGQSNELLNRIAVRYQSAYKIPGLAIAVIRPDTFYIGVSGSKQIGKNMPIQQHDLFHLGSNTKAFTAFLAAYLVEQDRISWSDRLLELVPELDQPTFKSYRRVTLEELLSHRAGIAPFESAASKEFRAIPKDIQKREDPRLVFAQIALSFPPIPTKPAKNQHLYSNGGYILAALMLERATDSTYESLLQEMTKQLKLNIHFGFPNQMSSSNVLGHRRRFLGGIVGEAYRSLAPQNSFAMKAFFAPAGDVSASIFDLAKWTQYHLRGLLGEAILLQPETYQKLHYGLTNYSLGWYNGTVGEGPDRFSYHGGSLGTFSSAIMLSTERNTGIVILVNAEGKQISRLKEALRIELWNRFGKPSQR